jgi:L-fuculose-phosphate aldolase
MQCISRCTAAAGRAGRGARASADRDRLRVAGIARPLLAEVLTTLGSIPIAECATPSTKELPEAVRNHQGATACCSPTTALTVGSDLFAAYYKMETIEHFAKISLVAAARRGCCRAKGLAAGLPAHRHQAPAPICRRPKRTRRANVQAPASDGARLVPDIVRRRAEAGGGEIRLTYRELSALIEEAVRSLQ